jgi:hypothetical protein
MSSHSFTEPCPRCGGESDALEDTRTGSFRWCPECGYTRETVESQCSLGELNERRERWNSDGGHDDLKPLSELPAWE